MSKNHVCPKCDSEETYKERIMGADSGDRICKSCGYSTSANSFKTKEEASTDKNKLL